MPFELDFGEMPSLVPSAATPQNIVRHQEKLRTLVNDKSKQAREWVDQNLKAPAKLALLVVPPKVNSPRHAVFLQEATLAQERGKFAVAAESTEDNFKVAWPAQEPHPGDWEVELPDSLLVCTKAPVTFCGSPRELRILRLRDPEDEWPSDQLQVLAQEAEQHTRHLRPSSGPWLWPLHDFNVSAAITGSHFGSNDENRQPAWWREVLWFLRILPPPGGRKLESNLARHYGSAVGYVFAWANLYITGLWALALPMVLFFILGMQLDMDDRYRWDFWLCQLWTMAWAQGLAYGGYKRHRVIQVGGASAGFIRPELQILRSMALTRRSKRRSKVSAVSPDVSAATPAATTPAPRQSCQTSPKPNSEQHVKQSKVGAEESAATRIQAARRGSVARSLAKQRLKKAVVLARYQGAQVVLRQARMNPDYQPPPPGLSPEAVARHLRFRKALAISVSVVVITVFILAAFLVLLSFTQLNVWLIYVWGRCNELDCIDPGHVRGVRGTLAEIGSDVALALLFDVVLGEACKSLAERLVSIRNYEQLYRKRYVTVMLSLFIEVLSKVGMFAILGFAVMPRWSRPAEPREAANSFCKNFPDYQVCTRLLGCSVDDPDCCGESLFCLAQRLPIAKRKTLFQRSVRGPFTASPFIRLIPTVLVPWVAKNLGWLVRAAPRSATPEVAPVGCCTRACRACIAPVVRLLELIFALDGGGVGRLRYVCWGWPFRAPEDSPPGVQNALEQSTHKLFEPLDELLEMKMSFVFVVFFGPVLPIGLLTTLFARLLEIRAKLSKLFFVRRRCLPEDARLVHDTQGAFTMLVAQVAVVWHMGLNFIAYNERLLETPVLWIVCWLVSSVSVLVAIQVARGRLVKTCMDRKGTVIRMLRLFFPT